MHNAQRQAANLRAAKPWLTEAMRADFARAFDCAPDEVEARLDARDAMYAKIAERLEYEDPYGYARGRF